MPTIWNDVAPNHIACKNFLSTGQHKRHSTSFMLALVLAAAQLLICCTL